MNGITRAPPRHVALIAGASGLIGRRITEHLRSAGDWDVIGLARNPPATHAMRWVGVDLADLEDCRRKLAGLDAVTHVFYAARFDHPEGKPESAGINAAMLRNLVTVLEPAARLKHVHAVHGSKYYGHQLGPVPVPMCEDTPRAQGRNFYFEQEDFLRERSAGARWTYSTSRPHSFCDPAIDQPRSLGLLIAVFAAIQRELGLALDFPGSAAAFEARTQFTDLALLARAIAWMAADPRCANQGFNVVNGDHPRWSQLWPRMASCFGLAPGVPRAIKLAEFMRDKGQVWDRIVKQHGLRATRVDALVLWPYGDYQFRPEWDVVSSMAKARALGFHEAVDSWAMFARQFEHYRASGVVP
ncbi:MAG: SDR family oxidoreductase [Betaproteobacteria bacterium]|nr:SDR family oxidoreductase [Betaproteobacteria bacterium]